SSRRSDLQRNSRHARLPTLDVLGRTWRSLDSTLSSHRTMSAANRKFLDIVKCSLSHWVSDDSATTGASLAFYCAFSLAPLLIIILTLSGWIVGAEVAYGQLEAQLTSLFGPASAATLLEA